MNIIKRYIKERVPSLVCTVGVAILFANNIDSVISALCCGWCCGMTFVDFLNYYFRNK